MATDKKILPHIAMSIYEDELDFILPTFAYNEPDARRIASEVNACYEQRAREEAVLIAWENDAERIARETEISWNHYHELQRFSPEEEEFTRSAWLQARHPEIGQFEYETACEEETFDDESVDYYLDMYLELMAEVKAIQETSKLQRTAAYRRKQEARHKKKLRRNAIDAMNNFDQRVREDMNNKSNHDWLNAIIAMSNGEPLYRYMNKLTYCKRRGGQWVQIPKSMSIKAEKLWAQAAKMNLI